MRAGRARAAGRGTCVSWATRGVSGPSGGRREKRELGLVRRAGPAWGSAGPGSLGLARDLGWVSREGWAGPGLSFGLGSLLILSPFYFYF